MKPGLFALWVSVTLSVAFPAGLRAAEAGAHVEADHPQPTARAHVALPLARVDRVTIPALDLEAVRLEDEERRRQGLAPRFAIPRRVQIKPHTSGTWEEVEPGVRMWRLRIDSPGARSINLGFLRYHMPPGGRLFVYSADYRHMIRPFTDRDNETHGQLWTPPVPSDDVVVELTIPESALPALDLELSSINIGYRGFGDVATALSGSCNVDVVCPEGDDWRDQIRSVAVISTGGFLFCTGFAVNNTAQDQTPYFMTANHCGIGPGNAASLVVFWNYENSWCRPPGSPASGGPGDGTLDDFQTGSFYRSSYSPSDFTLVELDDDPDPAWNVVFAGWDRSSNDATSAVGIHHPNTDEKRISFEYDPTTTTSYLGTSVPGDGTHIRITDWDLGTTEPGSSGSPLFNQDKRVVGQLHGGYASCTSQTSDWYGRFSVSWTGGGSPSTRLSDWLDPGNTGVMFIDHLSSGGLNVTPGGDVLHVGEVGGPFTNPSVTYTLTNPTSQPLDYKVALTASFGILLDGGTAPVIGTLAAGGGTTDVVVTLGPAIDSLGAGVYVEDITFDDFTNGQSQTRRHTVEIGQTLFSVEPETGLESGGPVGGPFTGSQVYTVTSERPTPVSVSISASDSWISLDGGAGPVTLNLSGTGDLDTVTVGFSTDAESLPPGIYNGTVAFTNLSGGGGDTTRPITLDVGRLVYPSTDTPQPINDNSTTTSIINVTDNYCINDLDVDVDITHTWIGDLIVELQSPAGTIVRLHDRTGGSADDIVQTYDDEGIPPDGPGLLSDFDSEQTAGPWTLTVSDNATFDTGTLNSWALRISVVSGSCLDCNNNGIPDDQDIAGPTSEDCNGNEIPDECDVNEGTSRDCNGNNVLDECECVSADVPMVEPGGVIKNRFISVVPGSAGCYTALRVTLTDLPAPFEGLEGQTMWVGEPQVYCENSGQDLPPPEGCGPAPGLESNTFVAAPLQCDPYYTDWNSSGTVHIYQQAVLPGATYDIQAIGEGCDTSIGGNYSAPLVQATSIWGDVVADCTGCPCGPPDGVVNVVTDVVSLVDKFSNLDCAPRKARADLDPETPDFVITINDITSAVDAFTGGGYPFGGPVPCP